MKVYVQHWDPTKTRGIGSLNATVWHDLKTWRGVVARCKRNWPGERCRVEHLDPVNVYRHPIEVREF
jgi:hypothetical protein